MLSHSIVIEHPEAERPSIRRAYRSLVLIYFQVYAGLNDRSGTRTGLPVEGVEPYAMNAEP